MSTASVIEPSATAVDYYIDPPEPGLYKDVPPETYSRWTAVRSSLLRKMERSPLHARYAMLHPDEDSTPAKEFGQAFHVAILEPERFNTAFGVMPNFGPRQSSKVRAQEDEYRAVHAHVRMISKENFDLCLAMRDAVWQHPTAKEILSQPGANELSAVWKDAITGLPCKGRQDRFGIWNGPTVTDVKSAADASRLGFAKSIAKYGYAEQAAFYLDGFQHLARVAEPRRYVLIAVEKEPPFAVGVYELDQASIAAGRKKYRGHLDRWAQCLESGVWEAYGDGCDLITMPAWAMKEEEHY